MPIQQKDTFSIAIPAYGRPNELIELLDSIYNMSVLPNEIVICEDFSKERSEINTIVNSQIDRFYKKNVTVNYHENEENFGYDKNIRTLIQKANAKWVVLIGNDDLFLIDGLKEIDYFCKNNNNLKMVSRTFLRFEKNVNKPLGISRLFSKDTVFTQKNSAHNIFRMFGFVGGIVLNKEWADKIATDQYDGTLYYQIYLAAEAFCNDGLGYISNPTIAGRTGNPPMFGTSEKDNKIHIPGSYSAKGRAKMWKGVLEIAKNTEVKYNISLYDSIKKELMIRQAFHIFEMNVGIQRQKLVELKNELKKLDLYNHFVPRILFNLNLVLGRKASFFYFIFRKIIQR